MEFCWDQHGSGVQLDEDRTTITYNRGGSLNPVVVASKAFHEGTVRWTLFLKQVVRVDRVSNSGQVEPSNFRYGIVQEGYSTLEAEHYAIGTQNSRSSGHRSGNSGDQFSSLGMLAPFTDHYVHDVTDCKLRTVTGPSFEETPVPARFLSGTEISFTMDLEEGTLETQCGLELHRDALAGTRGIVLWLPDFAGTWVGDLRYQCISSRKARKSFSSCVRRATALSLKRLDDGPTMLVSSLIWQNMEYIRLTSDCNE